MLRDLQRKRGNVKLIKEKQKAREAEKQRRISSMRARRLEEKARQEQSHATQATREREALEKEWKARAEGKIALKQLARAKTQRIARPIDLVLTSTGQAAIKGTRILERGLGALGKGARILSARMEAQERREREARRQTK